MCEREGERAERVKSLSKFAGTIKDDPVDFKTVTTAAQSQRHKHAAARFVWILRTGGKYSRLMKFPPHLDDDEPLKQSMLRAARILHSRSMLDPLMVKSTFQASDCSAASF